MSHHHDYREHEYSGNDPLVKSRRESRGFNVMWLKANRKMTRLEATGFTIFGLFLTAGGLFFAQHLVGQFRNNFFIGCFMTAFSAVFLYLGLRSLVNVLRSL